MIVIAHRGASGHAPENTMAAFRLARDLGADGIELDVQLTSDGFVVVLHDEDVRRTSDGLGRVSSMTLQELRTLDFGGWFSDAFQGERIPLLLEVVEFVSATGLWLNIELKGSPDLSPALPRAVADIVRGRLDPLRTILSTFDTPAMEEIASLLSEYPRALLVEKLDGSSWEGISRRDANGSPFYRFVHPHFSALDAGRVTRIHDAGLKIHPWTLDRIRPLARMVELGVDGVITGFPERALGK